LHYYNVC